MWRLRLCEALHCTLAELAERMGPAEVTLRVAYAQLYGPWWGERADQLAAHAAYHAYRAAGYDGGEVEDFVPVWGGADAADNVIEISAAEGFALLAGRRPTRPE